MSVKFDAAALLKRNGWESGKGLGKGLQGRTTYVRTARKNDARGIGGNKAYGDDTFDWWTLAYNKVLQKGTEKKTADQQLVYGLFLSGGVIDLSILHSESDKDSSSDSDTSSSEDEITDERILEACGGRTARRLYTGTAKAARVARQDQKLLKGDDSVHQEQSVSSSDSQKSEENQEEEEKASKDASFVKRNRKRKEKKGKEKVNQSKKKRRKEKTGKKSKKKKNENSTVETPVLGVKRKKRKEETEVLSTASTEDSKPKRKKKRKDKKDKSKKKKKRVA